MTRKKHNKISVIRLFIFSLLAVVIFFIFLELMSFAAVKIYNVIKKTNYAPSALVHYPKWWSYCAVLGPRPKPNLPFVYDGEGGRLGTDSYGFCHNGDPNRKLIPKPETSYRIFILGGSTVWGRGQPDNESTIPAQMERMLNQDSRYPFKIEVINAAVRGWMSYQEFSYLSKELLYYQPDMIIVLDGINDFYYPNYEKGWLPNLSMHQVDVMRDVNALDEKLSTRLRFHLKELLSCFIDPLQDAWKMSYDYMRYRSYFSFLAKNIFGKGRFDTLKDRIISPATKSNYPDLKAINPLSYACYIQNLKNIMGTCLINDLDCIVLFQPTLFYGFKKHITDAEEKLLDTIETSYRIGNIRTILPEYYRIVEEEFDQLAQKYNNKYTRVESLAYVFSDAQDTLYFDPIHYNAEGARILAQAISKIVQDKFLSQKNTSHVN